MAKKELKLHAVVSPTETVIVLSKLRPIIYDEEQVQYLSVGDKIADAFKTGTELRKILDGGRDNG